MGINKFEEAEWKITLRFFVVALMLSVSVLVYWIRERTTIFSSKRGG